MEQTRVYKIKDGKVDEWKAWCKELATTHRKAALETLEDEGVAQEMCINIEIDGTWYAVGYMRVLGESIGAADPDHPLNQEHTSKKQACLELDNYTSEIGYSLLN